jgi:hypothetical protein
MDAGDLSRASRIARAIRRSISNVSLFRRWCILDLDNYYHNRDLRCAGHAASIPMSWALRQLLTGWMAHPRPVRCPVINFGRTFKKALKCNNLLTDLATRSAIARERPRWRPHSTPTPSPPTPSPPTPSPLTPNQPPADPNAPLPGYGNLAPDYAAPTWHAPLAQAQYTKTRAADRADRYAAASRANAPPQQRHLSQDIALGN